MTKRIESPSKRWAGYVLLHDPLNLEQVFAIEDAREAIFELEEFTEANPSKTIQKINQIRTQNNLAAMNIPLSSREHKFILPVLFRCVSEWHLDNFPEKPTIENFPASPRRDVSELISWIWDAIDTIYAGEIEEVPNE